MAQTTNNMLIVYLVWERNRLSNFFEPTAKPVDRLVHIYSTKELADQSIKAQFKVGDYYCQEVVVRQQLTEAPHPFAAGCT